MPSKTGAFECANCGYVGSPSAEATCPKCGGAWKHAETYGTINMKTSLAIRIRNPKYVNDKKIDVTTVKAGIDRNVEETTIKRTMDGESADLQIKSRIDKDGGVELLHVHCQKDKESANWGKGSEVPIEKFFSISQDNGANIIRCKACGRRWSSIGRMETDQTKSNSPAIQTQR